jgi:Large eukaryotic DNA virus major capsid protein
LIHPFLFSDAVSEVTGMHMWTYALKPWDPLSPSGSTNYSKLANVQIRQNLSNRAIFYMSNNLGGDPLGTQSPVKLKLHSVFVAQNWNIARVANGSLGHPTL